jgi:hypothetical protein
LGVARRAPMSEVQRAFRREALRWHPDRRQNRDLDSRRFREVVHAYRTIRHSRREARASSVGEAPDDWPLWATSRLRYELPCERRWADRLKQRVSAFVRRHVVVLSLLTSASAATFLTVVGLHEPPFTPPRPSDELSRAYVQSVYAPHAGSSVAAPALNQSDDE